MLVSWNFFKDFRVFTDVYIYEVCRYSAARWNHVQGAALQLRLREHPEHHAGTSLTTKVPNPPGTWARNGFIVLLWLNVVSAGHQIGYTKRLLHLQPEDQLSLTSYQAVVQFVCHIFIIFYVCLAA